MLVTFPGPWRGISWVYTAWQRLCVMRSGCAESMKAHSAGIWAAGHRQWWHSLVPVGLLQWELKAGKLLLEQEKLSSHARNASCQADETDFYGAQALLWQYLRPCSVQLTSHYILWMTCFSGVYFIYIFQESQQSWEDVLIVLSKQNVCLHGDFYSSVFPSASQNTALITCWGDRRPPIPAVTGNFCKHSFSSNYKMRRQSSTQNQRKIPNH